MLTALFGLYTAQRLMLLFSPKTLFETLRPLIAPAMLIWQSPLSILLPETFTFAMVPLSWLSIIAVFWASTITLFVTVMFLPLTIWMLSSCEPSEWVGSFV